MFFFKQMIQSYTIQNRILSILRILFNIKKV